MQWPSHDNNCSFSTFDTSYKAKYLFDSEIMDCEDEVFKDENEVLKLKMCDGIQHELFKIHQVDGGVDEDEALVSNEAFIRKVYAANCEIPEVSMMANFLRNCTHIWNTGEEHGLCEFSGKHKEMSCIFCFFRSCCLRLNTERKKGPKSLKLYEIAHQLFKFDRLKWDWRQNKSNIVDFLLNTLKLLRKEE